MALVEASIEGPIDSVASDGAGGAIIVAMGVKVLYAPGPVVVVSPDTTVPPAPVRQKSLRSPSQRLTVADLLSTVPLPGRGMTPGFVGGTVIAEGFYSTDTASGANVFLANHITVDPAETVLIGAVTRNNGTAIQVNTVDIKPLTDPRISTNPAAPGTPVYLNAFGFEIQLASIATTPTTPNPPPPVAPPPPTSVEGYFAGETFHAFQIEYGEAGQLAPLADPMKPLDYPRISIERAQVRDRGTSFEIEVRGHISAPPPLPQGDHTLEFRVRDMKAGTLGVSDADWEYRASETAAQIFGNVRVDLRTTGGTPVQLVPPVQRFRFRADLNKSGVHLLAPERIEVRNITAEAAVHSEVRAELDTDVREA